jgi:hypothetical protein
MVVCGQRSARYSVQTQTPQGSDATATVLGANNVDGNVHTDIYEAVQIRLAESEPAVYPCSEMLVAQVAPLVCPTNHAPGSALTSWRRGGRHGNG